MKPDRKKKKNSNVRFSERQNHYWGQKPKIDQYSDLWHVQQENIFRKKYLTATGQNIFQIKKQQTNEVEILQVQYQARHLLQSDKCS